MAERFQYGKIFLDAYLQAKRQKLEQEQFAEETRLKENQQNMMEKYYNAQTEHNKVVEKDMAEDNARLLTEQKITALGSFADVTGKKEFEGRGFSGGELNKGIFGQGESFLFRNPNKYITQNEYENSQRQGTRPPQPHFVDETQRTASSIKDVNGTTVIEPGYIQRTVGDNYNKRTKKYLKNEGGFYEVISDISNPKVAQNITKSLSVWLKEAGRYPTGEEYAKNLRAEQKGLGLSDDQLMDIVDVYNSDFYPEWYQNLNNINNAK